MTAPLSILFLCTGNSARSVLAEALAGRLGAGRVRAHSAGSYPKGQINPGAVRWLEAAGFDPSSFRSKSWDEFAGSDAPPIDVVVTVCDNAAGEVCPVWPGHPVRAHWGLPDPAAVEGDQAEVDAAFGAVGRLLEKRIRLMLDLPIADQGGSPAAIRQRLQAIHEDLAAEEAEAAGASA